MAKTLHYKGVLYPVGEEPEELRDGRMCLGYYHEPESDYVWFGFFSLTNRYRNPRVTHVGPMPEIEVDA